MSDISIVQIDEKPNHYLLMTSDGGSYIQRKQPTKATENPLTVTEKVMLALIRKVQENSDE